MDHLSSVAKTSLTGHVLELYSQNKPSLEADAKIRILARSALALVCLTASILDLAALMVMTITIIPAAFIGPKTHFMNVIVAITMLFRSVVIPFGVIPKTSDRSFWRTTRTDHVEQKNEPVAESLIPQKESLDDYRKRVLDEYRKNGNTFLYKSIGNYLYGDSIRTMKRFLFCIELLNKEMLDISNVNQNGYSIADYFFTGLIPNCGLTGFEDIPEDEGTELGSKNLNDRMALALAQGCKVEDFSPYVSFLESLQSLHAEWRQHNCGKKQSEEISFPQYLEDQGKLTDDMKNHRYVRLVLDFAPWDRSDSAEAKTMIDNLKARANELAKLEPTLQDARLKYLMELPNAQELIQKMQADKIGLPAGPALLILQYGPLGLDETAPAPGGP